MLSLSSQSQRGVFVALILLASVTASGCHEAEIPEIKLGFLMPYPSGDSAVPARLAQEWLSAVKVALKVLGDIYTAFRVTSFMGNSNCDAQTAEAAARTLLGNGVVGVVGPACSEAAIGAYKVLGPAGVPMVSFAATAPVLGTADYPLFFRAVYSDVHQSRALIAVALKFSVRRILLFYTEEVYGKSLADLIQRDAGKLDVVPVPVAYGSGATTDYSSYFYTDGRLRTFTPDTMAVLATMPQATEGLFKAADKLGCLRYPWWFLGSDGATSFDLVGQGDNLTALTRKLQGEIGLTPYKGDYSPRSSLNRFMDYWRQQDYSDFPGLLTLGVSPRFNHTRAFVPYLFDATWSFFEAFNHILLWQRHPEVTPALLASCLGDVACMSLRMTTGQVAFNTTSGERSYDAAMPKYSFVNVAGVTWEEKGKVEFDDALEAGPSIGYQSVTRPGPFPPGAPWFTVASQSVPLAPGVDAAQPPVDTSSLTSLTPPPSPPETSSPLPAAVPAPRSGGGLSAGAIIVIVLLALVAVILLALGGYWFLSTRQSRRGPYEEFVRML